MDNVKIGKWTTLQDVPPEVSRVHDVLDRLWERDGDDWVTYGSFVQRLSTAVTDLSGWGPFRSVPWRIFRDEDGVWVVRERFLRVCHLFPSGAEAIAAFARGRK